MIFNFNIIKDNYDCVSSSFKKVGIVIWLILFPQLLLAGSLEEEMERITFLIEENRFEESVELLKEIEPIAINENNINALKFIFSYEVKCFKQLRQKDENLRSIKKLHSLGLATKNDTILLMANLDFGNYYSTYHSDYEKTLRYYSMALEISKSLNDIKRQSIITDNIANVFNDFGETEKARELYLDNLSHYADDIENKGINYMYIGVTYFYEENYAQTIEYQNLALNTFSGDSVLFRFYSPMVKINLAASYGELGQNEKAETLYLEGLTGSVDNGDINAEITAYSGLVEIYSSQPTKSMRYAKIGFKKSAQHDLLESQVKFLQMLVPLLKNESDSLDYYEIKLEYLTDSLEKIELMKIVETVNVKNNLADNSNEISQLKTDSKAIKSQERFYIGLLIGLTSLILIILFLIYYIRSFAGGVRLKKTEQIKKEEQFKLQKQLENFHFLGLTSIFSINDLDTIKENQTDIYSILSYFATSLFDKDKLDEVLWDITKNCISKLELEDCVIYWIENETTLVQKSAHGNKELTTKEILNPIDIPIGEGIVGGVAQSAKPEIVADLSKDKRYIVDNASRLSELAVPIFLNGKVAGVIDSEHSEKDFFTKGHLKIFQLIAKLLEKKISQISDKSSISITNDNIYFKELNRVMLEQKLYRNPLISLVFIADKLNISSGYLSRLINTLTGGNFNDFINTFRVNDVKNNLKNPAFNSYSILSIGLESGFNSKSVFYAAFKKHTGVSPSVYRNADQQGGDQ